ncbi:MAG: hypothetical protein ABR512_01750 [Desulfopila sp.]
MQKIKDWMKKNWEWLITIAVFSVFLIILLIYTLFFKGNANDENHRARQLTSYTIPADQRPETKTSSSDGKALQSSSFLLQPGPAELLQKLEGLSYSEFNQKADELPGLKVMWPVYFFSIKELQGNTAEVILDASEDGFGVLLLTRIDITTYPEILSLERGTKIWLAGEITGVDPSGTGRIMLATEQVRFDDYTPPINSAAANQKKRDE